MIRAIRGTRDLLPPDTDLWNRVEAKVRDVFARYNFHEIRTPIFEDTQLFSRSVGEETDIVTKEMFTWLDSRKLVENELVFEWLALHRPTAYADVRRDLGIDLIAYLAGQINVIVFRSVVPNFSAHGQILENLLLGKSAWRDLHPDSPPAHARLVVP